MAYKVLKGRVMNKIGSRVWIELWSQATECAQKPIASPTRYDSDGLVESVKHIATCDTFSLIYALRKNCWRNHWLDPSRIDRIGR